MVKVILKGKTDTKDFASDFINEITNSILLETKKELQENVKDAQCKNHKDNGFGTIYINATKGTVELDAFCCLEFKNEFKS